MLSVAGLAKAFRSGTRTVTAVRDVSLEVPRGCFFTLLGPSGCGKTTVLRCTAGLEQPDAGEIRIDGQLVFSAERLIEVPTERRPIGMVFQSYAIWPHMTVFGNAAYPLRYGRCRLPAPEVTARVNEMLERIGLSYHADRWATQLSGGQQQRLALARALLGDPKILLLDEPLSNLDANLRAGLRAELKDFQRTVGVTTLYVTHDQVEALSLSDRLAVLRDGAVEQVGTPYEMYAAPANAFVAGFLGHANLLRGTGRPLDGRVAVHCEVGELVCAAGTAAAGPVVVAVRPEDVELAPLEGGVGAPSGDGAGSAPGARNDFTGRVRSMEFLGERLECRVEVGTALLRAYTRRGAALEPGAAVQVRLPARACRVLGA
jgi:iron(III) transport system ATP-binding protein